MIDRVIRKSRRFIDFCFLCHHTGTIGLLGRKSPLFFTHGRMMKKLSKHLSDTPFYVDQKNRKVFVDFGNSLPIDENGSFNTNILAILLVAVNLDTNPSLTCADDLQWLGLVHNKLPNWYQNTSGIQAFPSVGPLSVDLMKKISQHPLVVAEVDKQPTGCDIIVLDIFGICVVP